MILQASLKINQPSSGNVLAWVHKPVDLQNITFCTRGFLGSKYYWHPQILRPRALFYRTDCTCRSKFLTHTMYLGYITLALRSKLYKTSSDGQLLQGQQPNIAFKKLFNMKTYILTYLDVCTTYLQLCAEFSFFSKTHSILVRDIGIFTKF